MPNSSSKPSYVHHIQLSKDTIHLYKVKAHHAGILGNECADATAKCSAENQSGHDIHINTNVIPIHPYTGQQGWKTLPQLAYQIFLTPANQGLQQKGFSFLLRLDAVKAHMHVQFKLSPE